IRALLSFTNSRSYAAAAAVAELSQTSVHRALGDLERILGKSLVDRRGRGTMLSVAGRHLARDFRLACNELRAMMSELGHDRQHAPITLGALPVARPFIVPTAIVKMVEESVGARVVVVEGDWQDLVEQLQDGIIDFIVGTLRNSEIEDIVQTPLS